MWPMGHVGIAYILYAILTRSRLDRTPTAGPTIVVVFGSLFPDLVDKPLAWHLDVLPTGRTLAHSLLFLIPLCLVVYLWTQRKGEPQYGVAFAVGAISHSLVDAVPALWNDEVTGRFLLWPLLSVETYEEEEGPPTVMELLQQSMGDPYFLSEFVFLGIAIVFWNRHRQVDGYYDDLDKLRRAVRHWLE